MSLVDSWRTAIHVSFEALNRARPRRLLVEDEGVKGCGLFCREQHQKFHKLGNILRVLLIIIFAPAYILLPNTALSSFLNIFKVFKPVEKAITPEAILSNAPGGGVAKYEADDVRPSWMLQVSIKNGSYTRVQVKWTSDLWTEQYVALGYAFESACVLFRDAGLTLKDPKSKEGGNSFSPRDRRRIAERVLLEYVSLRPDGTEYVWVDEFCLFEEREINLMVAETQRSLELGKVADIYRGSAVVCVFCHETECDHAGLRCPWGKRILALPEILHADQVIKLVRGKNGTMRLLDQETGHIFRGRIQANAAWEDRWHLYSIMKHAFNSGTIPLQSAIHALIVETIRRDEASGFAQHDLIGKALNGLLPRRSQLPDLSGNDGWSDLAWLLELNQGFYNAASLAAVSGLGEDSTPGNCWLGQPTQPAIGNERLEPVVTAFPVGFRRKNAYIPSALNVVKPETVELNHLLQRDSQGLFHNEEMYGLKWLSIAVGIAIFIIGIAVRSASPSGGLAIIYIDAIAFVMVEMFVGTMYVVRQGWVFLYEMKWGSDPRESLAVQDINLKSLTDWGERQLTPSWQKPTWAVQRGLLLDLQHRVLTRTFVASRPNTLVPLAVHGSGITCILLDRPDDPVDIAHKCGMASLPPYILASTRRSTTICIGASKSESKNSLNLDGDIDLEKQ